MGSMRSPSCRSLVRRLVPGLVIAACLVGCRGDRLTTIALAGPGTAEGKYTAGPDVVLWADTEGEWVGTKNSKLSIVYDVEVLQAGAKVGQIVCETSTGTQSFCGFATSFNNQRRADCEVLLKCELPATKPGEVVLRVTGRLGDAPRTKSVRKMNLNVRRR